MDDIIVGSEALAAGLVTRHQLRTNYDKLHYNVYAQAGMQARRARQSQGRMALVATHSDTGRNFSGGHARHQMAAR